MDESLPVTENEGSEREKVTSVLRSNLDMQITKHHRLTIYLKCIWGTIPFIRPILFLLEHISELFSNVFWNSFRTYFMSLFGLSWKILDQIIETRCFYHLPYYWRLVFEFLIFLLVYLFRYPCITYSHSSMTLLF